MNLQPSTTVGGQKKGQEVTFSESTWLKNKKHDHNRNYLSSERELEVLKWTENTKKGKEKESDHLGKHCKPVAEAMRMGGGRGQGDDRHAVVL